MQMLAFGLPYHLPFFPLFSIARLPSPPPPSDHTTTHQPPNPTIPPSHHNSALGAYLKRQRAAFPRFHFVGDEDLLEVIGNGSEPRRVCQHLAKMFAGVAQVRE